MAQPLQKGTYRDKSTTLIVINDSLIATQFEFPGYTPFSSAEKAFDQV
jgi:hypothetical protein